MAKFTSKGAILKVTVSSVLTTIPQMGDVTFTPGAVERVDVTTHDSASDTREFIQTWKGAGSIGFTLKYDPANSVHEVLRAAQGGASIVFNFILPDTGAATWSFSAHVTGFEIGASVEGAIEATVSLETTGAITFTA
tara:strand:+ start:2012 stop:2422 length:411 start_codon:yes stop_codon:yes gene_type:complete